MADIDSNVSFYVFRHSFAQYALEHPDMDIYKISKALGHSKLKTTERYLKGFDEELLDEEIEKIIGES